MDRTLNNAMVTVISWHLKRALKGDHHQAISKMQITFKDKAQANEKAQHTWEYVGILPKQQAAKWVADFTIYDREIKEV